MANSRFYSNTAIETTLSGSISAGATSITVGATTGFPGSFPYTLALDYGSATEELVSVTNAAGLTLTVTRGYGGTSAQSHSLGAVVRHVYNAQDATDFRTHEDASSNVHGVTGALVGATQSQTLTNKTLTAPTITNPTMTGGGSLAGTYTGTPTFSGAVVYSGAPSFTGNPVFSGGVTVNTLSLLVERGATTDPALRARVTGDSQSRLLAQADGKLIWGSGSATGDVTIFREAANVLGIEDAIRSTLSTSGGDVLQTRVTGDAGIRYLLEASGLQGWGDGSSFTLDTSLYRSAANTLKTDGALIAVGNITAPNLPKFATGSTTFVFSATSTVDNAISFPGGRFSGTPKVVATLTSLPSGSSALIVRGSSVSSSGATLRCNDVGGVSRTLSITCDWIAIEE